MDDFTRLLQTEMGLMSRRLRGMAMISRGIVPNLVISQRVVDRIVGAAQSYLADETGETMVGLIVDTDEPETMPTLYVLDCIQPDESSIRRSHMFEQGDELQQDIFLWLMDNWQTYLEIGKDMFGKPIQEEWKVELKHLGDWHKQPGYMIQPSGGDLMTALRIMDDEENNFEFLLVPIVTLGHPSVTSEEGATVNYFNIPMDDGTSLRMDWWYIHRDVRVFQPITPRIVSSEKLPALTPYPWHILDADLLDEEVGLLQDDEQFLIGSTTILWEVDGDLPLEICFIVGRAGRTDVFLVITDWDYPQSKPRARIAPFVGIDTSMYIFDIFSALWDGSKPVEDPPGFEWDPNSTYIVDYLAAIENHMGVRPPHLAMPMARVSMGGQGGAVRIDVNVEGETAPDQAEAKADGAARTGQAKSDSETKPEHSEEETS